MMIDEELDPSDVVAELRDAFAEGDGERLAATVREDIVWHVIDEEGVETEVLTGAEQLVEALESLDRSDVITVAGTIEDELFTEAWQYPTAEAWEWFASKEDDGDVGGEEA
jgi:ketosteroid isomerase-like protein